MQNYYGYGDRNSEKVSLLEIREFSKSHEAIAH